MAQSTKRYQMVGDYMMGKQIGAGSFSTVWHARHRVHGTEVAIKEIVTSRLNPKLQESLKSEIYILKRIDHPNIIRLHDMVEESGKIYIILEYCKGGDLSIFIQQRQGKIPQETAKHFMHQLAKGLKVLRENNLIHRDLKPQRLLWTYTSVSVQSANHVPGLIEAYHFGCYFMNELKGSIRGSLRLLHPNNLEASMKLARDIEDNISFQDAWRGSQIFSGSGMRPSNFARLFRGGNASAGSGSVLGYIGGLSKGERQSPGSNSSMSGQILRTYSRLSGSNFNLEDKVVSKEVGIDMESLQPRGLAETLCGSPLYMAPEIMLLQKYDAKADLWSVGAILFQLVTGKTPFTGNNQIELLQNIVKSTELKFPPKAVDLNPHCMDLCRKLLRRNPVERLTFEEFFNHPYISERQPAEILRHSNRVLDGFSLPERNTEQTSQEDCLPFSLDDDDSSGPNGSPSFQRKPLVKPLYGFALDTKSDRSDISNFANKTEIKGSSIGGRRLSEGNLKVSLKNANLGLLDGSLKDVDSLESIDQDYVIVSGPVMDIPSSVHPKSSNFPSKTDSKTLYPGIVDPIPSAPVKIIRGSTGRFDYPGSVESRLSAPGISQGSMEMADASEQPLTDCMTRISSLQHYAAAITELVNEKIGGGKQLEAFSVQLVLLAIWKQALHICHTHAASAVEVCPSKETTRFREVSKVWHSPDVQKSLNITKTQGTLDLCSEIEEAFLQEFGRAEELAKLIEPGNMEMPDAMELLYQSALALGRHGAVDEYMGDIESAAIFYSKAARLLMFILVEAPCLILNPPFSLTNSDRFRVKNYIDVLNNRQSISQSQRMAILKPEYHASAS